MTDTLDPPLSAQADLQRLRTDFEFSARHCLQVRGKDGALHPFVLNRCQRHIHQAIERQRKKGKVRIVIVKSRQQGASTYIEGRYFWLMWRTTRALRAFILTHRDDATANLFGMAQRFYENLPDPIKPKTRAASAKELVFADSGASYAVATAGANEVGRSDTIQLLHGSEVPSWPNAAAHISGLFQALADTPESEAALEATGKGMGNVFHSYAVGALRGESEFVLIFTPWYWSDEYRVENV